MKPRFSPFWDRSWVKMADCFAFRRYSLNKKKKMRITNKLGDRMIKQFFSPFVNLCYCFLKMKKMFWVVYFLPMIAQEKDWSHPVKLRIRRRSCRRFSAQAGCCQGSSRDHIPQIDNDNHHYFIIIINKSFNWGGVSRWLWYPWCYI